MKQKNALTTPALALGTLYTIGYANSDEAARLVSLMCNKQTLLIDIRYSPRSRWLPQWNRAALTTTYGHRYIWDQRLGNVNYQQRERGIQLCEEHIHAVYAAASRICQGTNLILLCACKDARTCHRSLVAKLIQGEVQRHHMRTLQSGSEVSREKANR